MCCKSWPLWLGILGLCVAGALLRHPVGANARPPESPKPPRHSGVVETNIGVIQPKPPAQPEVDFGKNGNVEVKGIGLTPDDAEADAYNEAARKIHDHLAEKYGETYTPTVNELKGKKIVGDPTFEAAHLERSGDIQKAIVQVTLTAEQVTHFRNEAREQRVGVRMRIAGVVLAGLMALLLVGGGYLRLEEATKGYYTTLLRVGAVAVLLGVGVLLFRLWSH